MDLSNILNNTNINNNSQQDKLHINTKVNNKKETNDNRFKFPWNKLEKGPKLNRLLLFIEKQKNENDLNDDQYKKLKSILFKACDDNLLNKITQVDYDLDTMKILSIKNLEYNSETKQYKLRTTTGKQRSVSKSKSQLDRLMKCKHKK